VKQWPAPESTEDEVMHTEAGTKRVVVACVLGFGLAVAAAAHAGAASSPSLQGQWVESWAAAPQEPVDPLVGGTPQSFSDQTIREIVRLSAGGGALRIRLTNEYGTAPVTIGPVHVAVANGNGEIVPGSDRVITFSGGQTSVTIPSSAPALSDPILFPLQGLTSLAVSLYVPSGGNPGPATPHSTGQQTAYLVPGDQTGAVTLTGAAAATERYFLSGVDVYAADFGATVVTFGDSITDGFHSTVDANHRWPDYLAQRLQGIAVLSELAVANAGISGNRVLSDGIGPSALSRFDRDVLSRPGVRYVVLLEGINDLGLPALFPNSSTMPSAIQIIAGYRQLIARAHDRGVLIFGGTLMPFESSSNFATNAGEVERETINAFIRGSGEFDGVIDFDAAVRNPANPLELFPAYDSGDHVHPNDSGYAAMAAAVDLRLFLLPPYQGP
jgi:lysophospholipase L1-like esterase